METHTIGELNSLYSEAETCDSDIFAEQRSNILLASGDHYTKKGSKFWNRIRDEKQLSNEQKLRLTKNHTHKITNAYINNIVSQAPGVQPVPNNPKELSDQKAAELNKAVWQFAKTNHQLNLRIQSWVGDYVRIGEVAVKIFFNPTAGRFLGYEQAVDPETGVPLTDPMTGEMVAGEKAIFSGDIEFERILCMNLLRAKEAKSMNESPYLINRKMAYVKDTQAMTDDEDKIKKITETADETFMVFDGSRATYDKASGQCMVKEFYFRPCVRYPEGYFYITTGDVILSEGPLPYGIYPIVYEGFDEIATTPRHRSIIKQLRPYQAEINRTASKIAEHQITLGDDKVILQNGSKVTNGPQLPGIRTMFVTGMQPTILGGRTGEQYVGYMQGQISEMYQVANITEDAELNKQQGADPFAQLYMGIRQKKKFAIYAQKFEGFLVRVCDTYLQLARQYFDANMLIPAIGRSEYINIDEFKSQEPLKAQIKLEPISDDIESQMGRHLTLNHILQYVGPNLEKDDIGKLIKQMPYANAEESFSDFTLDSDTATNIILALDRGQTPQPGKQDNGAYILKRMSARQKQSDYTLLSPQIQSNYDQMMQFYEQLEAEKAQEIKAANSEFIPSGGAMIKVDYYVPDPTNKQRSIRSTLPAESIDWLIKRLATQGSGQELLAQQTIPVQSDIARMLINQGQPNTGNGIPGGPGSSNTPLQ